MKEEVKIRIDKEEIKRSEEWIHSRVHSFSLSILSISSSDCFQLYKYYNTLFAFHSCFISLDFFFTPNPILFEIEIRDLTITLNGRERRRERERVENYNSVKHNIMMIEQYE